MVVGATVPMVVVGVGVEPLLEEAYEEELHAAPSTMNFKAAPTRIHGRLPPACSDVNTAASVFYFRARRHPTSKGDRAYAQRTYNGATQKRRPVTGLGVSL